MPGPDFVSPPVTWLLARVRGERPADGRRPGPGDGDAAVAGGADDRERADDSVGAVTSGRKGVVGDRQMPGPPGLSPVKSRLPVASGGRLIVCVVVTVLATVIVWRLVSYLSPADRVGM